MKSNSAFKCVVDANALYPIVVRDLLFWFAYYDLCSLHWSDDILQEWKKIFLSKGKSEKQIDKSISLMNNSFEFASISNYHYLIPQLQLPDIKDNHVLAAAITSKSEVIITFNLKDFPASELDKFDIRSQTPDDFLTDIIDLNPELSLLAFKEMVTNKTNPKISNSEMLTILRKNRLEETANLLQSLL
jgi:predicted nucleic acid-binding protein